MKILSIETSCDETGVSIVEGSGHKNEDIHLLGNALASQIELHAQYGGVFPALAKRAHADKFVPLLIQALEHANLLIPHKTSLLDEEKEVIAALCVKEQGIVEPFYDFFSLYQKPAIDHIAVTTGPGLEPALWVGVNAAKVLSAMWNIPLIPINHMEGHVLVSLIQRQAESEPLKVESTAQKIYSMIPLQFPALALLVSGGHTELVLIHEYSQYEKIGQTRDDAVGEAFDKVARMLGLPYPGGPAISKLAAGFRALGAPQPFILPRPMQHSGDYDFSFSGIKTAVLYAVRDRIAEKGEMNVYDRDAMAAAFEDAAIEVLISKTLRAIEEHHIATLIVGGGVAGNTYLRSELAKSIQQKAPRTTLLFPEQWLSTDNSVMIGIAAYIRLVYGNSETQPHADIRADGNLSIIHGGFRK